MDRLTDQLKNHGLLIKLALLLSTLATSACTTVQPWEKNHLAKQEMTWQPDPLRRRLKDHMYHSKEGSSGSTASAGGGCGCN